MGTISRTYNGVQGEGADIDALEVDIDAIYTLVNGNLDKDNIAANAIEVSELAASAVTASKIAADSILEAAMDYTSGSNGVEVWRTGPNYVGTDGGRIARVKKTGVDLSTGSPKSVTFIYATDCSDGDPDFSDAPAFSGTPMVTASDDATAADAIFAARVTASTYAQCTIEIQYGYSIATVTIEFMVAGELSVPV